MKPSTLDIPNELFWDINPQKLDMNTHKQFIIERVMERGEKKAVMTIWKYYGAKTIKNILIKARYLDRKTIFFFANQFEIPPSRFRAYNTKWQ